jgi:multimeric flavodoxin WrbA
MTEKIVIILGSARKNSDTKFYADFIFNERNPKIIDLLDFEVSPYSYNNKYPVSDKFLNLIAEILEFETFVFATPVYWYSMSGLMKTFFDRLTELKKEKKEIGRKLKNKSVLLLVAGADREIPMGFEIPFKLTAEYFDMNYKNHIYFSTTHSKTEEENMELKRIFIGNIE